MSPAGRSLDDLRRLLRRLDGRGYRAYRDLRGTWSLGLGTLHVDHVQADPFAAPSRVRLRVPMEEARLPRELFSGRPRRIGLEDYLARRTAGAIRRSGRRAGGSGGSGVLRVDAGGQEVLERTAVRVTADWVEVRLHAGLPAAGRRILGAEAEALLCRLLPEVAGEALPARAIPLDEARLHVECVENQEHVRSLLSDRGLVAFVADGSVLPRESGASDLPLPAESAVVFRSPDSLRVTLEVPNPVPSPEGDRAALTGMGVPEGVTLIVGGGYHGKSTLLRALERGVYPHVPGDGREWVVTSADAVKIRAEDGRRVEAVDIGAFIGELPLGRSTAAFRTEDASGSTSQAANIMEALEVGARVLLLDEDTSATNFMIRDARMQALVPPECEPITPFLDRVRALHREEGVSTILVMGGSGDYLDVADRVLMMRDYLPRDVTAEAGRIAGNLPGRRRTAPSPSSLRPRPRVPLRSGLDPSGSRRAARIRARGTATILYGEQEVDLRAVEQVVDPSQTRAIGRALHLLAERFLDRGSTLGDLVGALDDYLDARGLDRLDPGRRPEGHPGDLARPRRYEIAAAINRLRTLTVEGPDGAGGPPARRP